MTNYEFIISQGPEVLAKLFTDSKIDAIKRCCAKIGITYMPTEETYNIVLSEHLAFLMKEKE